MGFAVYQGHDWDAKDFDTGWGEAAKNISLSLANIPRHLLEAVQMRKENELKDREMANKEKSQKAQEGYQAQSLANDSAQIQMAKDKTDEEKRRWEEDKPMRGAELEAKKAETAAQMAHTAALNRQSSEFKDKEGREAFARQLQSKAENSDAALQAVFINKGGKIFENAGAQKEWDAALSNKMVAESSEMRARVLSLIEQKYKGVPKLFNYDFLNSYNTAAAQRNLDEGAFTQLLHSKPGQPFSPDFKSPNALPVFKSRQMQQEAIWNSIQKVPNNDPRLAAVLKTFPQLEGDEMAKARLSNIISGQKNNLLFDPSAEKDLRSKLQRAIAIMEKEKKEWEMSQKKNKDYLSTFKGSQF